jgi:hypothetical protein
LTPDAGRAIERADMAPQRHLMRARAFATLMDSSITIPGTGRKIGLDPLLGLVPFVGDFAGAILSGYIVIAAALAGVPTFTLIRMLGNIAFDTLVGSIQREKCRAVRASPRGERRHGAHDEAGLRAERHHHDRSRTACPRAARVRRIPGLSRAQARLQRELIRPGR